MPTPCWPAASRSQGKLYDEIVGRIKQDDSSVPYRLRGYWYYSRYETGKDYPVVARRQGDMEADEEILHDENAMAAGHNFFQVGESEVSQDNKLLAWADDTIGRRQYTLRVKDIASGRVLEDVVPNIEANVVWGDDNRTLYYIEKDPVTLLSKRVKAHVLGTPVAQDRLVYESRTKASTCRSVARATTVPADHQRLHRQHRGALRARRRQRGLRRARAAQRDFEYQADHLGGRWVMRTNWQAKNFRLMQLPTAPPPATARAGRCWCRTATRSTSRTTSCSTTSSPSRSAPAACCACAPWARTARASSSPPTSRPTR
jgi:oligopeptidase B